MEPPETLKATEAKLWLAEATGKAKSELKRVKYVKPFIYHYDPKAPPEVKQMYNLDTGDSYLKDFGQMVEVYRIDNLYGELEDEIPLSKSPFAKEQ